MSVCSEEDTPPDPRDVYSPDQLRVYLAHYWFLDIPLRPRPEVPRGKLPKRRRSEAVFTRYAVRQADLDAALRALRTVDPLAVDAITDYYVLDYPIDRIATRHDCDERTIYRRIERGIYAMARHLGWRSRRTCEPTS